MLQPHSSQLLDMLLDGRPDYFFYFYGLSCFMPCFIKIIFFVKLEIANLLGIPNTLQNHQESRYFLADRILSKGHFWLKKEILSKQIEAKLIFKHTYQASSHPEAKQCILYFQQSRPLLTWFASRTQLLLNRVNCYYKCVNLQTRLTFKALIAKSKVYTVLLASG